VDQIKNFASCVAVLIFKKNTMNLILLEAGQSPVFWTTYQYFSEPSEGTMAEAGF
jgi:hypothetical protein